MNARRAAALGLMFTRCAWTGAKLRRALRNLKAYVWSKADA